MSDLTTWRKSNFLARRKTIWLTHQLQVRVRSVRLRLYSISSKQLMVRIQKGMSNLEESSIEEISKWKQRLRQTFNINWRKFRGKSFEPSSEKERNMTNNRIAKVETESVQSFDSGLGSDISFLTTHQPPSSPSSILRSSLSSTAGQSFKKKISFSEPQNSSALKADMRKLPM